MKKTLWIWILVVVLSSPAVAQQRYALLIGGLGGTQEYRAAFRQYLFDTRRALEEAGFSADHVIVLAESDEDAFVTGISTMENVQAEFERLRTRVRREDQVYIILFGHGSFDGRNAFMNIPGRDLSDTDYADLVAALPAEQVVFINTASASGPFAQHLSAPGRIVITATRTGTQRNITVFPRFLVEAFGEEGDLDRDGNLSVRELFTYAAEHTSRFYEQAGNIPTENALMDDTGSGRGFRLEELEGAGAGNLAGVTYVRRRDAVLARMDVPPGSALGQMIGERERIERAVADLKAQKPRLTETDYYDRLETLLVQLARLNDRIEEEMR